MSGCVLQLNYVWQVCKMRNENRIREPERIGMAYFAIKGEASLSARLTNKTLTSAEETNIQSPFKAEISPIQLPSADSHTELLYLGLRFFLGRL